MAPAARRAQALGVVLVEVREEVGLADAAELVHGHQPLVHGRRLPCRQCAAASPSADFGGCFRLSEEEGRGGERERRDQTRAKMKTLTAPRVVIVTEKHVNIFFLFFFF